MEIVFLVAAAGVVLCFFGILLMAKWVYIPTPNTAKVSMGPRGGVYEHHPGISFKRLLSTMQKETIDTRKMVLTSGGQLMSEEAFKQVDVANLPAVSFETKTGGLVYVIWYVTLGPRKGGLATFIKQTNSVAAQMTWAYINRLMSKIVFAMTPDQAVDSKESIGMEVGLVFGGPLKVSEHEEAFGITVDGPVVASVNKSREMEQASNYKAAFNDFLDVYDRSLEKLGDPKKAYDTAMAAMKMSTMIDIKGANAETGLLGAFVKKEITEGSKPSPSSSH